MSRPAPSQEVLDELQSLRVERLGELGRRPLAWLALVPAWTERLAVRCAFPTPALPDADPTPNAEARLDAFLRAAESFNVCVRGAAPSAGDRSAWHQARALAGLAPYLPPNLRAQLSKLARTFADPQCRLTVLAALLQSVTPSESIVESEQVVQGVMRLPAWERTELLARFVPGLPKSLGRTLLSETLGAVIEVADEEERARLLAELGPHLDPGLLTASVASARAIDLAGPRAGALGALAIVHGEPARTALKREAVLAALRVEPAGARSQELVALIPVLDGSAREEALNAIVRDAAAAGPSPESADDLIKLIPLLSAERSATVVPLALESARAIESDRDRALALAALLARVGDPMKSELTNEAAAAANALFDPVERVEAFAAIARGNSAPEWRDQARLARDSIENEVSQARATFHLCSLFTDLASDAVGAIRLLPDDQQKVEALLELARLGVAGSELLAAARRLADEAARADALIGLAPYLDAKSIVQGLALARTIEASRTFWMPDGARAEIFDDLRDADLYAQEHRADAQTGGWKSLWTEARDLGSTLYDLFQKGEPMPATVARWSELAKNLPPVPGPARGHLTEAVRLRAEAGEIGEAQAWLQAGKLLAAAVEGDLTDGAAAAEHALELAAWRAHDLRQVRRFLRRNQQIAEFERLVDSQSPESWALHYLGLGGVGKTTLLRHITAQLAPKMKIATARVDFDFLPANYPGRRPGELLLGLADKLSSAGPAAQFEKLLAELWLKVQELHAELKSLADPADPLKHLNHRLFGPVLRVFVDLLGSLGRKTVLILDTCEELTKFQPIGAQLPNLDVTHEILRQVHDQLPEHVRVVYAGRRLLAQAGDGWSVDLATGPTGLAYLPGRIPYLRLHIMRGFDDGEADEYFSGVEKVAISDRMRQVVLMRSREAKLAPEVSWQPPRASDGRRRYNPYDLKLYADWLREEPDLAVETVASGVTDPYVHVRIVDRLKNNPNLQHVLGAAVLLRRFDLAMIQPALPAAEKERMFRELGDQEWIDYRVGDGHWPAFLDVSEYLYPRLLAYYQPREGDKTLDADHRARVKAFVTFRAILGPALDRLVRATPLGELSPIRVDAAVRVLDAGPAAECWDDLARRIPGDADWRWALNVTRFLLDDDGVLRKTESTVDGHPLRAGVLAVYVATQIHLQSEADVSGLWAEVLEAVPRYPIEETRDWLTRRSHLGVIAAMAQSGRLSTDQVSFLGELVEKFPALKTFDKTLRAQRWQLVASLCAALDAVLELVESGGRRELLPDPDAIARWAPTVDSDRSDDGLGAFALTIAGRVNALLGHDERAASLFLRSGRTISGLPSSYRTAALRPFGPLLSVGRPKEFRSEPNYGQRWFDWRAPARLGDRVRLEVVRWFREGRRGVFPPEMIAQYIEQLEGPLNQIDSERLCSGLLDLQLDVELQEAGDLVNLARADEYDAGRQPVCSAHRAVPPLFVTLARGFLALGWGERALGLLRDREDMARAQRDERTLAVTRSARLRTLCRLRLPDARTSLDESLNAPKSLDDGVDVWPMRALCFGRGSFSTSPEWYQQTHTGWDRATKLHLAWRSQPAFDVTTVTALTEPIQASDETVRKANAELVKFVQGLDDVIKSASDAENVYVACALMLDGIEALLAVGISMRPPHESQWVNLRDDVHWRAELRKSIEDRADRLTALELACVKLRSWALVDAIGSPLPEHWAGAIPGRRQAEIALEEGELLALRLPARSVLMLDLAANLFEMSDDHFGVWTSSLLGMIAAIRATDRTDAEHRLRELRPHYDAWREWAASEGWGAGLPGFSDLNGWSGLPESRWGHDNPIGPLRCWLDRLAACVTWYNDPTGAGGRSRALRARLEKQYGTSLPVELDLTPAKKLWKDTAKKNLRRLARKSGWLVPLLIFLLSLVPYVFGLYQLAHGRSPTFYTRVVVAATAGICASGLLMIIHVARRSTTTSSRNEIPIRIELAENTDLDQGAASELLVRLSSVWKLRFSNTEFHMAGIDWKTPGLEPYGTAALKFPDELPKRLLRERLTSPWFGERVSVRISSRPDSPLDTCPWEAYLYEAVSLARAKSPVLRAMSEIFERPLFRLSEFGAMQIYRGSERESSVLSAPVWSEGRVHVAGARLWGVGLSESWRGSHADVLWTHEPPSNESGDAIKVLHMIGRATRSGSRWEFLITREPTGVIPERSVIVTAERLPTRRTGLVVLQDEPAERDYLYRPQTDRERIGELRAFAARVFEQGAFAVIVLPQMSAPLTLRVVSALAAALPGNLRESPGLPRLLDAVSIIRDLIALPPSIEYYRGEPGTLPPGAVGGALARRERALDVSLFARGTAPRLR
jgi:hypothetical protein